MKCYTCPSYKKGKGTKKCLSCDEFKSSNILPRYKPCVDYVKIPRMILEALADEPGTEYYRVLDPLDGIILFSKYHLELSDITIAKLLNISEITVRRRKKSSLIKLSTYALL